MLEHDVDYGPVQAMESPRHLLRKWWDFHGISQENDGISIGFDVIFDQTTVKQTRENPCHIFTEYKYILQTKQEAKKP